MLLDRDHRAICFGVYRARYKLRLFLCDVIPRVERLDSGAPRSRRAADTDGKQLRRDLTNLPVRYRLKPAVGLQHERRRMEQG